MGRFRIVVMIRVMVILQVRLIFVRDKFQVLVSFWFRFRFWVMVTI